MKRFTRPQHLFFLAGSIILALVLSSCGEISRVTWDKEAVPQINKVAVVLFTVPEAIELKDDPREQKKSKGGAMEMLKSAAASMANTGNGVDAATLGQKSFIKFLNAGELSFKAISQDEMMSNGSFTTLARKHYDELTALKAKRAEEKEKKQGTAGKVLGFMSSFSGGSSDTEVFGAGPKGLPSFGLAGNWSGAESALMGVPQENEYIKGAIAALGVDAALVINDPGMSWGCENCIASTGTASTQSSFLVTMVDKNGKSILEMRQWFIIGGGNAAMVSGVINPLQHDTLFDGHGEKMARVFVDFYKEKGGK